MLLYVIIIYNNIIGINEGIFQYFTYFIAVYIYIYYVPTFYIYPSIFVSFIYFLII